MTRISASSKLIGMLVNCPVTQWKPAKCWCSRFESFLTRREKLLVAVGDRPRRHRMTQREAVIEAMRANGGFATLGHLYTEALKIPRCAVGDESAVQINHPYRPKFETFLRRSAGSLGRCFRLRMDCRRMSRRTPGRKAIIPITKGCWLN